MDSSRVIGTGEIAKMLNVSKVRAYQIAVLTPGNDFPKPVAVVSTRRLWHADDVYDWAVRDGRQPRNLDELL